MSKQTDSLADVKGPDRVHYQTGTLLNADDFLAEQNYHRGRLARALQYTAGSGTLAGLKVEHEAATDQREERIKLNPGLAIDRLGRMIEIPATLCMRLGKWYEQTQPGVLKQGWHAQNALWDGSVAGVTVDLFIKFIACERGKTPVFALGPFDSLDAVAAARIRDGYEAELIVRTEDQPGVPESPWQSLARVGEDARPAAYREWVFSSWQENTQHQNIHGLEPLTEHAAGKDYSALFLARLVIPADQSNNADRPQRRENEAVQVNNDLRSFVMTPMALAGYLGIDTRISLA